MQAFRIFLASPGDVMQERQITREVIEELRHERRFRDELNLQVIAWDQPGQDIAMPMGTTPQQAISDGLPQPCECDLVLILLWSRMGTPLPADYTKPDGSPYLSGTEWEYWNAMKGFQQSGRPWIWMYHRTEKPLLALDDPQWEAKRSQWQRLQTFLGMIRAPDGSIVHGLNEYPDTDSFRKRIQRHLRNQLEAVVQSLSNAAQAGPEPTTSPDPVVTAVPNNPLSADTEQPHTSAGLPTKPPPPYPGAKDWGEGDIGRWLIWEYHGVEQQFRWIPPGSFMMGSPDWEAERYDDEVLHEVTLSQGFWLADTTVTQALWGAVMGNNPSNFEGTGRPVENVSWDDVQQFLQRLEYFCPDWPFRLPSEAQWEYACRAGSRTAFSFGANITAEQANFDAREPYQGGPVGDFQGKTVQVKSLPPNAWGLYEMHGNVWEWCRDYYAAYPDQSVTDPVGPDEGAGHVVRGGSWVLNGRYLRSACRDWYLPGYRDNGLGFRLSLGH